MKTGIPDNEQPVQDSLMKRFRDQFSVFFVFLVFSSFVWVVIKLSKDFTSTITYNVNFKNAPEGRIISASSDTVISVGLDAKGFTLIKYHFLQKKPVINIDLAGLKIRYHAGKEEGCLPLDDQIQKIASQIGVKRDLVFVSPDTIRFEFLTKYRRQIPVLPQVSYELRPQFMLYDSVQIQPDSIWVFGPEELIDTIQFIYTEQKSFTDLAENQELELRLLKPESNLISLSENRVNILIPVEKYTERSFELPVNIVNSGTEYALRIFPEKVIVNCLVALKDYNRVDEAMFEAVVTYDSVEMQTATRLKVNLVKYPSFVHIARVEPERIEFILIKSANKP
ncbi:MAG: YbbR-like domain-containing protein [Bacteroidales bacterium]